MKINNTFKIIKKIQVSIYNILLTWIIFNNKKQRFLYKKKLKFIVYQLYNYNSFDNDSYDKNYSNILIQSINEWTNNYFSDYLDKILFNIYLYFKNEYIIETQTLVKNFIVDEELYKKSTLNIINISLNIKNLLTKISKFDFGDYYSIFKKKRKNIKNAKIKFN